MIRDRKSQATVLARPNATYATAEAESPIRSAGRRPYRSETRPQIGAAISWAIEN
jgi:hypothetical protein